MPVLRRQPPLKSSEGQPVAKTQIQFPDISDLEKGLRAVLDGATPVKWTAPKDGGIPTAGTGLCDVLGVAQGGQWDQDVSVQLSVGAASRDAAWRISQQVETALLNLTEAGGIYVDIVGREFGTRVDLATTAPLLYVAHSQWVLTIRAIDAPQ